MKKDFLNDKQKYLFFDYEQQLLRNDCPKENVKEWLDNQALEQAGAGFEIKSSRFQTFQDKKYYTIELMKYENP